MSAPVLSKKQQKTLAFRNKQKSKPAPAIPEDVPESDLLDDNEEDEVIEPIAEGSSSVTKDKKRKRDDTEESVKGKRKEKTAWDEDDQEETKKKSKKEIKQRFILFVGNLGYKATREDIANHFKESIGHIPSVRLLTEKPNPRSPANTAPKSRGIAFLEVLSSAEMQAALKLHHSELQGRVINVELTAGGGGKSGGRMEKIKERNERVGVQRENRAEREGEVESESHGLEGQMVEEVTDGKEEGKTKMRGGRRMKNKPKDDLSKTKSEPLTGAAAGWASRTAPSRAPTRGAPRGRGGGPPGGRGTGGKKWEPTGANALVVG